jgi:hypothetical protein
MQRCALLRVGQIQSGGQVAEFFQQGPHHGRVERLPAVGAGGAELVQAVLGVALLLDGFRRSTG